MSGNNQVFGKSSGVTPDCLDLETLKHINQLFGDAAFAQTVLEGRKVEDVFAVVWGWGVAVMMGVATCGGVSGGHINPAVTVAFATLGKLPWKKVGHYLLAQHLGAFVASAVLFVTYKDALDHFDPNRTITGETATAYIWATYPKPYVSLLSCFFDQIVGTGLLMFTALACIDRKNLNLPAWSHPIVLGFMISALAMCFGANCMAPLNPARDFATRCFTAVAGYGSEVFTYRNYWWVGLFGPHVGAIIGGWIYYLGIELHFPETREDEKSGERYELTMALNSANVFQRKVLLMLGNLKTAFWHLESKMDMMIEFYFTNIEYPAWRTRPSTFLPWIFGRRK